MYKISIAKNAGFLFIIGITQLVLCAAAYDVYRKTRQRVFMCASEGNKGAAQARGVEN